MSRWSFLNAAALAAALAASFAAAAVVGGGAVAAPAVASRQAVGEAVTVLERADGRVMLDAAGAEVPLRDYRRILSLSMVADALLVDLAEPERLVGVSAYSDALDGHRLGQRPRFKGVQELERIIDLRPDVVVMTSYGGDLAKLTRLREAGLTVCNLGDARGWRSLPGAIRRVATLLGDPARGERYLARLSARLHAVATGVPPGRRRRGMYLALHGDRLYGGTVGTSYHDVLVFAGIDDLAAMRYRDWPAYSVEQLLGLAPPLIVTKPGMADRLRRLPGLERLPALQDAGGIIEIDGAVLDHPGPPMLEAAEALHRAAYPDPETP